MITKNFKQEVKNTNSFLWVSEYFYKENQSVYVQISFNHIQRLLEIQKEMQNFNFMYRYEHFSFINKNSGFMASLFVFQQLMEQTLKMNLTSSVAVFDYAFPDKLFFINTIECSNFEDSNTLLNKLTNKKLLVHVNVSIISPKNLSKIESPIKQDLKKIVKNKIHPENTQNAIVRNFTLIQGGKKD